MGQPQRLTWKQPRPSPVEWVTPTLLRSALSCPARVAFERDPRTSGLRRTGLRAALGTVAHKTWEKRAHGLPFDALWDKFVQEAWDGLVAEWAPAVPPSPTNWPGWALTKTRLRKAFDDRRDEATPILHALADESVRPFIDASSSPPPLPWNERWIEDRLRRIAGKPDLVERVNGVLTVVDLKTGIRQGAANEDQRRQLLLYAALVQHELGELPVTAEIRDASGSAHSMAVAESEVEKVLEEAQETWMAVIDAASGGPPLEARPSEQACCTCPFRSACKPFLEQYQRSWACGHAVVGEVVNIDSAQARPIVDLQVVLPSWRQELIRLIGFPLPQSILREQIWGASDFEGPASTALARWNTLVARWDT